MVLYVSVVGQINWVTLYNKVHKDLIDLHRLPDPICECVSVNQGYHKCACSKLLYNQTGEVYVKPLLH